MISSSSSISAILKIYFSSNLFIVIRPYPSRISKPVPFSCNFRSLAGNHCSLSAAVSSHRRFLDLRSVLLSSLLHMHRFFCITDHIFIITSIRIIHCPFLIINKFIHDHQRFLHILLHLLF